MVPLANALDVSVVDAALGITRVVNNNMSGTLHRVTVERGIDTRLCQLIAFGGAGPMHAVQVARIAGIKQIVVPEHSSTFSALGCLRADFSYTQQQTVSMGNWEWDPRRLDGVRECMQRDLRDLLAAAAKGEPALSWVASIRYVGQSSSVEIADPNLTDPASLGKAFRAKHTHLYGFETNEPWQVIALVSPRRCRAAVFR